MAILKKPTDDVGLLPVTDRVFAGLRICEVFDTSGNTQMACGIHVIGISVTVVEKVPVDDVLYILDGEIEIDSNGERHTYRTGDFAYLRAGERQVFTVR